MDFTLISNFTFEVERWDDGTSSHPLVNKTVFSFLTNYDDLEVSLYYSSDPQVSNPHWNIFSSGWNASTISKEKEGNQTKFILNVDVSPLLEKLIQPGALYRLKVRLKRSGYSNVEEGFSDIYRRAKGNSISNIAFSYSLLNYKNAIDSYRGTNFGIKVSAWPSIKNDKDSYPQLRDVTIKMTGQTGTYVSSSLYYTFWGKQNELTSEFYQKGQSTLQVIVTDAADRSFIFTEKTYTDLASISFPGMSSVIGPSIYNPHINSQNNQLEIRHSYAQAIGTSTEKNGDSDARSIKNIVYDYVFTKGSITKTISVTPEEDGTLIKAVFPRSLLVEKGIFENNQVNGKGTISIKVKATDVFGNIANITGSINYDYYLEPYWDSSNNTVEIRHNYFKLKPNETTQFVYEGPLEEYTPTNPSSANLDLRYYCTNEIAQLKLPIAIDPNRQDITYEIEMAQGKFLGDLSKVSINNVTFSKIGQVIARSGQQTYEYRIPDSTARQEDRYCYFRIKAKDNVGAELDYIYSTFILLGRTQKPSFKIVSTKFNIEDSILSVKFERENFDLGDSPYYDSFIRGSSDKGYYYEPKAVLKITVCRSPGFEEGTEKETFSKAYTYSNLANLGSVNDFWEANFDLSHWTEGTNLWKQRKIYTKLELSVQYNNSSAYILNSQPYTYFTIVGGIPTVAHRKNHVGINTTLFNDTHVLKIAPIASEGAGVPARTIIEFEFLDGLKAQLDLSSRQSFVSSLKNLLDS